jgi:hypothetical protein
VRQPDFAAQLLWKSNSCALTLAGPASSTSCKPTEIEEALNWMKKRRLCRQGLKLGFLLVLALYYRLDGTLIWGGVGF